MTNDPPRQHSFTHPAMATEFRLNLLHADAQYARQAAQAAFQELEAIEGRLSRFVCGSDIYRINRLSAGQSTVVHPDTLDCLAIAEQVWEDTGGLFDVAYAAPPAAAGVRWELDARRSAVRAGLCGLSLDLGGIGKGFALDRLAMVLSDWGIAGQLLVAGGSTLLARGSSPGGSGWTVHIGPEAGPQPITLCERAISASGTAVRGQHVIDPRSGRPAGLRQRAWAAAPTAAVADALSTALMVMDEGWIGDYCRRHPETAVWLLKSDALWAP